MRTLTKKLCLFAASLMLSGAAGAVPTDFSFTGEFVHDDDVQAFGFTVGAPSSVTLRAWSHAGGVNAAGAAIAAGGFDTILPLFDNTGTKIAQNNGGGCGSVDANLLTAANGQRGPASAGGLDLRARLATSTSLRPSF